MRSISTTIPTAWFVALTVAAAAARTAADDFADAVNAYVGGDSATAMRMLRPLAEAGHADAQFHLALMYENGLGVEADPDRARQWYDRACPLPSPGDLPLGGAAADP